MAPICHANFPPVPRTHRRSPVLIRLSILYSRCIWLDIDIVLCTGIRIHKHGRQRRRHDNTERKIRGKINKKKRKKEKAV